MTRLDRTPYAAQFTAVRKLAGIDRPVKEIARDLADITLTQPGVEPVRLGDVRDASAAAVLREVPAATGPRRVRPRARRDMVCGYEEDTIWKAINCPVLLLRGEEARGGMLPRQTRTAWPR